jgi:hypothetical protein
MRSAATRSVLLASLVAFGFVATATSIDASTIRNDQRPAPQRVASARLLRASAPSAPRAPKAFSGNGHATVRWTAPRYVNGSRVYAYLVWPYVGGKRLKAREFHSRKTVQVVYGLPDGRKYTFRVAARNGMGMGPKSSATPAVLTRSVLHPNLRTRVSAPSAPRAPKAFGGNGRVTVRWSAPRDINGSRINAYLVWPYLGGTRLEAREFHSRKTTQVVYGLPNGRKYTFRVAARNGMGIGRKSSASAAVRPHAARPAARAGYWRPSSAAPISWNWQLQGTVPTNTGVQVFDIDGFDSTAATVAALHRQGTRAICYIDFGTSEDFRPDFGSFPASVQGNTNGWPGERWLDIRQIGALAPIMTARMRMCVQKGFDALEPDNIDGYANSTGFPLTAQDQLNYNIWIANTAHSLGLSVGLKNDNDQTAQLQPYFDWALDEQCNQYSECGTESPFVLAGKAVFNAEYSGGTGFCASDGAERINGAGFDLNLDGADYQPCGVNW